MHYTKTALTSKQLVAKNGTWIVMRELTNSMPNENIENND